MAVSTEHVVCANFGRTPPPPPPTPSPWPRDPGEACADQHHTMVYPNRYETYQLLIVHYDDAQKNAYVVYGFVRSEVVISRMVVPKGTTKIAIMNMPRLEIILIAIVVFVLVLFLAVFIVIGAGYRTPRGTRDAKNGQRETHWNMLHQADQGDGTYHDHEASFIKSVRRRSQSLAEELRLELINLKRNLSLLTTPSRSRLENTNTSGARRFSIDQLLRFSTNSSELVTDCESCFEYLDSPLSATGRDEDAMGTQRRQIRPTMNAATYEEAQQWDSPLL
ncbi:hypothetical protein IWW34DRAFT_626859 [Fusarium oxysporum f. sp. albedinis]|nr:hypothetical protein IWW34DRAFT_626859 [Fusarium oxysporum f. sp. albedinis]